MIFNSKLDYQMQKKIFDYLLYLELYQYINLKVCDYHFKQQIDVKKLDNNRIQQFEK